MSCSATLRTYVMGTGSSYWFIQRITGLDDIEVKGADTDLHFANGVVASRDYYAAAPIVADLIMVKGATVAPAISGLRSAWAPSTTDLTLSASVHGSSYSITGRPRGLAIDRRLGAVGVVRAQVTFLNTF